MSTPPTVLSPICQFHAGTGGDHKGRLRDAILAWDDDALERSHDFIQWLFPTVQASAYNNHAPTLTAQDIATFHREPELQQSVRRCFLRMLLFFEARRPWRRPGDHNLLRITRVLDCLNLVGLPDTRDAFYSILLERAADPESNVAEHVLMYWRKAAGHSV